MNADKRPSEPKINIEAMRAMLGEVLEEKLGQHETRLIDGFKKILDERAGKLNEKIRNIFAWIASQFK